MLRCTLVAFVTFLFLSCTSNNEQKGGTSSPDIGNAEEVTSKPDSGTSDGTEADVAPTDTKSPDAGTEPPPIKAEYVTSIGDWNMAPGKEVTSAF